MKHNYAVIDLGSNTFNLLIFENNGGRVRDLYRHRIASKLAKGAMQSGVLKDAAIARGLVALEEFLNKCREFNAEKIAAFATSAVRSAGNGMAFVALVKERLNLDIEVISGKREAELIHKGVMRACKMNDKAALIMDIGGGSTEFVLCDKQQVFFSKSYDLGATRLIETLALGDPVSPADSARLIAHLDDQLGELLHNCKSHVPEVLIGSSGSFDSFKNMEAELLEHETFHPDIPCQDIDLQNFYTLKDMLLPMPLSERLQLKGLTPMRADLIVVGVLLTDYILQRTGIKNIQLSTYSLKEGVMQELIEDEHV